MDDIQEVYDKYEGIYGYRRIYIYIRIKLGKKVNHKRIYRLMKKLSLIAVIRRKRTPYKCSTPQITAENKLNREFQEDKPNAKWLTDVTEFRLKTGNKVYLSAIYDLGTSKIVSYETGISNNNQLVFNTFDKAVNNMNSTEGILLHSNRGYQYTSRLFKEKLNRFGMIQSMSRVSRCIDNGPMESVWGTIKSEIYKGNKNYSFENLERAKSIIDDYIFFLTMNELH